MRVGLVLGPDTLERVQERRDTGKVVLEGGGIDVRDVGQRDRRDVSRSRGPEGRRRCRGGRDQSSAYNRRLKKGGYGCDRVRRKADSDRRGLDRSAQFWPASITAFLGLEVVISSDPPMELATELMETVLAVEP